MNFDSGDNTLVQTVKTSPAVSCSAVCLEMLNRSFMVCLCLDVLALGVTLETTLR